MVRSAVEEFKVKNKRFCYACGSDKTNLSGNGYPNWTTNNPTDLVLCQICYYKYIINPVRKQQGWYRNYIRFGKRQIFVGVNPRKGICSLCRRKDGEKYTSIRGKLCLVKTTMHHIKYHEDDPLRDTIELCRECHGKESWRLGSYVNRPNNNQPRDPINGRFITRLSV